jgi:hypothetical protein
MKYIVYQTTNLINNKIYIGVHKIKNKEDDGYIGCGVYKTQERSYMIKQTAFHKAVAKYGPEHFIRETLKEFPTKRKAYEYESEIVTLEFCKLSTNYNMKPGGRGGFNFVGRHHTEESKQKIKDNSAFKGKKRPQEFADNMSKLQKGKVVSKESKLKSSKTKKERFATGKTKSVSRSISVIDLLLNVESNFKSLKEFATQENLNYDSLKVFVRKGYIYKERYKVSYTSELKIQL